MTTSLRIPRMAALITISALVLTASAASFTESYHGLYDWAIHHGLTGFWSDAWPLQVDVFIATGELALFVGLADQWSARNRLSAWAVTLAGLAVSLAGNIGHVSGHDIASRLTAAVPPLSAFAALAVGLQVLKLVVARNARTARMAVSEPAAVAQPAPGAADPAAAATAAAASRHDGQIVTAQPASRSPRRPAGRPSETAKPAQQAVRLVRLNPGISGAELGRKLGMSERSGQRILASVTGSTNGHTVNT